MARANREHAQIPRELLLFDCCLFSSRRCKNKGTNEEIASSQRKNERNSDEGKRELKVVSYIIGNDAINRLRIVPF